MSLLRYRAGRRAAERLRDGGLSAGSIRVVVGAASGPRWLALAGLDRALIGSGLVTDPPSSGRRLLVGASAGAWRMMALASDDPAVTHERLIEGYVGQIFPRGVGAGEVSGAYLSMIERVFPATDRGAIVGNAVSDVALLTTRLPSGLPWHWRPLQIAMLVAAGSLHRLGAAPAAVGLGRAMFHSRPSTLAVDYDGEVVPLTEANLPLAALASGTVPVYMRPVRAIPAAPAGVYVDGGLGDYHLRRRFHASGDGIVLFPHHQSAVAPTWFDRRRSDPRPPDDVLDDLLLVHPSEAHVATLPGSRLPDRHDFLRFADSPHERIRRWREAVRRSEVLGEALLRDLESGAWRERLEPLRAGACRVV